MLLQVLLLSRKPVLLQFTAPAKHQHQHMRCHDLVCKALSA